IGKPALGRDFRGTAVTVIDEQTCEQNRCELDLHALAQRAYPRKLQVCKWRDEVELPGCLHAYRIMSNKLPHDLYAISLAALRISSCNAWNRPEAVSRRHIGTPWPAQRERSSVFPRLAAAVRKGRVNAFWIGNAAMGVAGPF